MLYPVKKIISNLLLIFILIGVSCSKDLTNDNDEFNPNLDTDDLEVNLEGDLQISDFIWKGLNEFYCIHVTFRKVLIIISLNS